MAKQKTIRVVPGPAFAGHKRGGSKPPPSSNKCCFAGEAVKAFRAGRFRLARRFLRLDLKIRMGVL